MARLLAHLFEVTERFGMQTRTELILLQRTMVVVEGVGAQPEPGDEHVGDGAAGRHRLHPRQPRPGGGGARPRRRPCACSRASARGCRSWPRRRWSAPARRRRPPSAAPLPGWVYGLGGALRRRRAGRARHPALAGQGPSRARRHSLPFPRVGPGSRAAKPRAQARSPLTPAQLAAPHWRRRPMKQPLHQRLGADLLLFLATAKPATRLRAVRAHRRHARDADAPLPPAGGAAGLPEGPALTVAPASG